MILASRLLLALVLCAHQAAFELFLQNLGTERYPVPPWVEEEFSSYWQGRSPLVTVLPV